MNLSETARSIFAEAIKAADPYNAVRNAVSLSGDDILIDGIVYSHDVYHRIIVIGAGKASSLMGKAIEDVLGDRIESGWINTKYKHSLPLEHIHVHECGHPVPDEKGVEGAHHIIRLLGDVDEETLIICLLSGGGSALVPSPAEGISLKEKQEVTRLLLNAGATIAELNAVRKHLSILKGGGMARLAVPARLHVLILSDVIGDRLDTIASGPSSADESTYDDCIDICRRYGILEKLPVTVKQRLLLGRDGAVPETAKPDDRFLTGVVNTLVGNNSLSVRAAKEKAESLGFNTIVLTTTLEGEASQIGTIFASIATEIHRSGNPVRFPACVIAGGETTVTIHGKGKGGRNQEMALAAAFGLSGLERTVFLSGGTDGTDGPTDAAGGIVDGDTLYKGMEMKLNAHDYLADNNSYEYLQNVGGLVKTGPTGTNVMDIQILLIGKESSDG